jgi:site-specific recombinase XerD
VGRQGLEGDLQALVLACRVDNFSEATVLDYKKKIGQFIRFMATIGVREAGQVTADHVRLFLLNQKKTSNAVTIYNHYRDLRRFFNFLVEEKRLGQNPMAPIKPPRTPKTLIKPLSVDQLRQLLDLCDDNAFLGLRNKAIILIFLDTAIRLSEMANMQIRDLDLERGVIKIMGKGAKERVVAIQGRTRKVLLRYLLSRGDRHPCVWVSEERRPLTLWGIEGMIRKLGKWAGLKNVRCSPHTFRHTSATLMLDSGAKEFEVQAILGHSTLTMTRRYVATLNSEKAAEAHKRFSPVEHLKL